MNLSLDAGNSPAPETKTTNVGGRALICKNYRDEATAIEINTRIYYLKYTIGVLLDFYH
jgi:hypothetical protein